tara:strand:- start:92255 stop:92602 length:348 start_codon:yes stop_codon:yes gene_type:complete
LGISFHISTLEICCFLLIGSDGLKQHIFFTTFYFKLFFKSKISIGGQNITLMGYLRIKFYNFGIVGCAFGIQLGFQFFPIAMVFSILYHIWVIYSVWITDLNQSFDEYKMKDFFA